MVQQFLASFRPDAVPADKLSPGDDTEAFAPNLPGAPTAASVLSQTRQIQGFLVFTSLILTVMSFILLSLFLNRIHIQEENNTPPTRRVQDLVSLLNQAETKQETLEREVLQLKERLKSRADSPLPDPDFANLKRLAGLTEISGPGIILFLQESGKGLSLEKGGRATQSSVQSDDLLKLVNDLKAAGAQGISVNGQRIVTTTEIVNAGPNILINQTRIAPPIEVRAIGQAANLKASLLIRGGILEYLAFFGINASIQTEENVTLPPYNPTGSS